MTPMDADRFIDETYAGIEQRPMSRAFSAGSEAVNIPGALPQAGNKQRHWR